MTNRRLPMFSSPLRAPDDIERQRRQAELKGLTGALQALRLAGPLQQRLPPSERLAAAVAMFGVAADMLSRPIANRAACPGSGCNWCCYEPVDASPAEVVTIVRHIRASLSNAERAELTQSAAAAGTRANGLNNTAYAAERIACPLLAPDGSCGQYKRRPLVCRTYHSMDKDACQRSFEDRSDEVLVPGTGGLVSWAVGVLIALGSYLESKDIDGRPVNLIPALDYFLNDGGAVERWESGARLPDHIVVTPQYSATALAEGIAANVLGR